MPTASPDSAAASSDRDGRLSATDKWIPAQVAPLAVFMGFTLLLQLFDSFFTQQLPTAPWWRHWPEQWFYPLQTVVTLAILAKSWRYYDFRWSAKGAVLGIVFGAIGIGCWLLPTTAYDWMGLTADPEGWMKWLGIAARTKGFNPAEAFGDGTPAYWTALSLRFLRAAVAVALAEEIFWRNFLMRYSEDWDGNYWKRPFGKGGWKSFAIVTGLFILAHHPLDYAGALVYGSLTYLLCIWTRSLGACVIMHAVANLLMGLYAVHYGKLGLW